MRRSGIALALAVVGAAGPAAAQITGESGDFNVERMRPALGGQGILGVDAAEVPGIGTLAAAAWIGYSRDPLTVVGTIGDSDGSLGALVRNRMDLDLQVGWVPLPRLLLRTGVRPTLFQDRDRMIPGIDGRLTKLEQTGVGEVFVAARYQLLAADEAGIDLALEPAVAVYPVSNNYLGEDSVVFRPTAMLSRSLGIARLAFDLDYVLRKQTTLVNLEVDDEVEARAGVAVPLGKVELQAALAGAIALSSPFSDAATNPLELMAGARMAIAPFTELSVGGASGFNRAFGNPAFRIFAGVDFALGPRKVAAAILAPLVTAAVEPPPAPIPPPAADPDPDRDGVIGAEDRCPTQAGPAEEHGCPLADRDGDTVADAVDACPDVKGTVQLKGCPPEESKATLTAGKIEIKEQVQFTRGKADLRAESNSLLDDVAKVLRDNPAVKVRIEGYTDSTGSEAFNLRLSQQRAAAVMGYLVQRGIDAARLTAKGIGEAGALESNKTAAGRARNRRVEFVIAE